MIVRAIVLAGVITLLNAADAPGVGKPPPVDPVKDLLALETAWGKTGNPGYFHDALQLLSAGVALNKKDDAWQQAVLDVAEGIISKPTPTAYEFGQDSSVVRACVADAAVQLTLNVPTPTAEGQWQDIRGRRMRLLMHLRGSWFTMRNAFWDDQPIMEGRGLSTDEDAPKPADHNRDIQLQQDLTRFMKEQVPAIDKFVVTSWSYRPVDIRELNELLTIGAYAVSERAEILRKVSDATHTSIPEVIKKQLVPVKKP